MLSAELRDKLVSAGFTPETAADESCWVLTAGQARWVYVRILHGAETMFTIYVEEWRGGEGYEDEELRTTSQHELLDAIPYWTAWANEPFTPPVSWWRRLRAYFGRE